MSESPSPSPSVAALQAVLDGFPGAYGAPWTPPRGASPLSTLYKVSGKMFAVLTLRGALYVVLKADPVLVEILRDQYTAVGKRTHLDPRHWIAIDLDGDMPADEIAGHARTSYGLVVAGLSKKQRAVLDAIGSGPAEAL